MAVALIRASYPSQHIESTAAYAQCAHGGHSGNYFQWFFSRPRDPVIRPRTPPPVSCWPGKLMFVLNNFLPFLQQPNKNIGV